ncbi:MAG: GNAT family N-acetyltransferase [Coriobacteriales bacterium]|jgi:ribosomal protein S18 acetylase RimI-like enzyme|nr:GNAT family N-acetyltransferase [Coriobacteriales bacterium]
MENGENIIIRPVDRDNWADFEALFQAKGGPSYCWCMVWRMTKEELKHNNSVCRKEFIKQRVLSDTPIGMLGYFENEAIAWCSVGPRETHQRLGGDEDIQNVWSITCFYVKKEYRRQGFVKLLIESAKSYAKENGAEYVEAYPVEEESPSYRFMGFVKSFKEAGFGYVKMAGTRRHVMVCRI